RDSVGSGQWAGGSPKVRSLPLPTAFCPLPTESRLPSAHCLLPTGPEAGLRLARAMHSLWVTRPHYGKEGRRYLDLLLASPPAAGRTAARAAALSNSAALAFIYSDYPAARAQGQESLAIFEELDD